MRGALQLCWETYAKCKEEALQRGGMGCLCEQLGAAQVFEHWWHSGCAAGLCRVKMLHAHPLLISGLTATTIFPQHPCRVQGAYHGVAEL